VQTAVAHAPISYLVYSVNCQ